MHNTLVGRPAPADFGGPSAAAVLGRPNQLDQLTAKRRRMIPKELMRAKVSEEFGQPMTSVPVCEASVKHDGSQYFVRMVLFVAGEKQPLGVVPSA